MHLLPFCGTYRIHSSRASSGARCPLFPGVAIVAVGVTGAAEAFSALASAPAWVPRAGNSARRVDSLPGMRGPEAFVELGYFSRAETFASRGGGSIKQCGPPVEISTIGPQKGGKSGLLAAGTRRLGATTEQAGKDDTAAAGTATPDAFTAVPQVPETVLRAQDETPTSPSTNTGETGNLQGTRAEETDAGKWVSQLGHRESAAAPPGVGPADHGSGSREATGLPKSDGRMERSHAAGTPAASAPSGAPANAAPLWSERNNTGDAEGERQSTAPTAVRGGYTTPRAAIATTLEGFLQLPYPDVSSNVSRRSSQDVSYPLSNLNFFEKLQIRRRGHSGSFPEADAGSFVAEDSDLSSSMRPGFRSFGEPYTLGRRGSSGVLSHRQKKQEDHKSGNIAYLVQAMGRVRKKLACYSWGQRSNATLWDNPITAVGEQVKELLFALRGLTELCAADGESGALPRQPGQSIYSELAAFVSDVASGPKAQRKRETVAPASTWRRRARRVGSQAGVHPSQVSSVLADVSTAAYDALSEASALMDKVHEQPSEWIVHAAVETLNVRVRSLRAAASSFKNLLQAFRSTTRQLLAECPQAAKRTAKKRKVPELLMKVTSRVYSTVKYICVTCTKISATVRTLLPYLLHKKDLTPADNLRFAECFESVSVALTTVRLRVASATLYNEKLAKTLKRAAALTAATAASIPTAQGQIPGYLSAASTLQWNGRSLL